MPARAKLAAVILSLQASRSSSVASRNNSTPAAPAATPPALPPPRRCGSPYSPVATACFTIELQITTRTCWRQRQQLILQRPAINQHRPIRHRARNHKLVHNPALGADILVLGTTAKRRHLLQRQRHTRVAQATPSPSPLQPKPKSSTRPPTAHRPPGSYLKPPTAIPSRSRLHSTPADSRSNAHAALAPAKQSRRQSLPHSSPNKRLPVHRPADSPQPGYESRSPSA